MRRKARITKSWVDLESRHSLVIHHPFCQLCVLLQRNSAGRKPCPAVEFHHICKRGWNGADDHRNGLAVCRACHEWLERAGDGVRWSLLAKFHDEGRVDLAFLEAGGKNLLRGRIADWLESVPEWRELAQRMLRDAGYVWPSGDAADARPHERASEDCV